MFKGISLLVLIGAALTTNACIHPKVKYRKSALLDPMMDPSKTADMTGSLMNTETSAGIEKGSLSGDDGSLGSSCPTCG